MKRSENRKITSIDFDLRQLEIFCKVFELGSFSKAANAVCLAQASVSERIATLESMVGTRLLDRLGRQILLTRAGKILYRHAILLLDMKRTACLEMQDFLGLKKGNLHIGGSTIPGEYILPKVIGRFREKYPLISVFLTVADTNAIESGILDGHFEIGVVGSMSTHKSLTRHKVWKDELVLAVPGGHRWADKEEISIKELVAEPFILREQGSGTLRIMENYFQASGKGKVNLNVAARLGSSTAVKEGIKAGLGVSILSLRAIDTELETGKLSALKINGITMTRSFYLIRDKRRIASPLCQAMFDFLPTGSNE